MFFTSTMALPIAFGRKWRSHAGARHLSSNIDDFYITVLHWELERQIRKYEAIRWKKAAATRRSECGTGNYGWLRRETAKACSGISLRARREIQDLCERTRPAQLNNITAMFDQVLVQKDPPPEEVPNIFIEVLKSCLRDGDIGDLATNQSPSAGSLIARVVAGLGASWRQLQRPNTVEPGLHIVESQDVSVESSTIKPFKDDIFLAKPLNYERRAIVAESPPINTPLSDHVMSSSGGYTHHHGLKADEQAWPLPTDDQSGQFAVRFPGTCKMAAIRHEPIVADDMEVVELSSDECLVASANDRHFL